MRLVIGLVALLCASTRTNAADICTAVALRDVPAIENPTSILKKGQIDEAITEYQVNKKTGRTSFCSHGGYCYPTHVRVGGNLFEALKLTNCRVRPKAVPPYSADEEEITYELDPIRSMIPANALRFEDLDNKFLAMGLCSACAGTVAQIYIEQPSSRCATLARSALEGNPDATKELQVMPEVCNSRH